MPPPAEGAVHEAAFGRGRAAEQGVDRLIEQDRGVLQGLVHMRP
jgi:hypothetical protein